MIERTGRCEKIMLKMWLERDEKVGKQRKEMGKWKRQ